MRNYAHYRKECLTTTFQQIDERLCGIYFLTSIGVSIFLLTREFAFVSTILLDAVAEGCTYLQLWHFAIIE